MKKKTTDELEYRMSKKLFDAILGKRTEGEKRKNPKDYVVDVINREFGLKGTVTSVSIYSD